MDDLFSADDPFASSGSFDWAEEVEQELFSAHGSSNHIDGMLSAGEFDGPASDILIVIPAEDPRSSGCGAGYTLRVILDNAIEEGNEATKEVKVGLNATEEVESTSRTTPTDVMPSAASKDLSSQTAPTPTTLSSHIDIDADIDADQAKLQPPVFNTADTSFTIDALATDDSSDGPNDFCEILQLLSATDLLNLDTYAIVFRAAARHCAAGPPFWLNEPPAPAVVVL